MQPLVSAPGFRAGTAGYTSKLGCLGKGKPTDHGGDVPQTRRSRLRDPARRWVAERTLAWTSTHRATAPATTNACPPATKSRCSGP
jgi:hypothetical protein